MVADRELDALVAEKVMGMAQPEWTPTHEEVASAYVSASRSGWYRWPWEINYWGREKPIQWESKRFSTDIAAAWEVVAKLKADGMMWCIYDTPSGVKCGINRAPMECLASVEAETAPLAICLAALKSVGTPVTPEKTP